MALVGYRDRNKSYATFARFERGRAFAWVVSHTYRKTVATFLDGDGPTARTIADQLGHARISITQDESIFRAVITAT